MFLLVIIVIVIIIIVVVIIIIIFTFFFFFFETVIPVYQSIRHHALEEWNILQYCCEKARDFLFSTHLQTGFEAHPAPCIIGSRPLSLD
jgi:hypothetical protein